MMGGWGKSMYAVDKTIKKIIIIWNVEKAIRINMKNIRDKFEDSNIYWLNWKIVSLLLCFSKYAYSMHLVGT